jgi:hypothetical protein
LAFNGNESARVEDQRHSAGQPGGSGWCLLLSLIEDAISLRKLLFSKGALLRLPGSERLPQTLIPEGGFDCLGDPARNADAEDSGSLANLATKFNPELRGLRRLRAARSDGPVPALKCPPDPGRA